MTMKYFLIHPQGRTAAVFLLQPCSTCRVVFVHGDRHFNARVEDSERALLHGCWLNV